MKRFFITKPQPTHQRLGLISNKVRQVLLQQHFVVLGNWPILKTDADLNLRFQDFSILRILGLFR